MALCDQDSSRANLDSSGASPDVDVIEIDRKKSNYRRVSLGGYLGKIDTLLSGFIDGRVVRENAVVVS